MRQALIVALLLFTGCASGDLLAQSGPLGDGRYVATVRVVSPAKTADMCGGNPDACVWTGETNLFITSSRHGWTQAQILIWAEETCHAIARFLPRDPCHD